MSLVSRSHSSRIDAVGLIIQALEKEQARRNRNKEPALVKRITLGRIASGAGGAAPKAKFVPISGGLRAQIRGGHSVQQVWIYTDRPEEVQAFLKDLLK